MKKSVKNKIKKSNILLKWKKKEKFFLRIPKIDLSRIRLPKIKVHKIEKGESEAKSILRLPKIKFSRIKQKEKKKGFLERIKMKKIMFPKIKKVLKERQLKKTNTEKSGKKLSFLSRIKKKEEEISLSKLSKGRIYETDLDKIIELVKKYKKLKFSQVAKLFNVKNEKVEEWGSILEQHGLLNVYYPTFGEAELRCKDYETSKKPESKNKSKIIRNLVIIGIILIIALSIFLIATKVNVPKKEKMMFIPLLNISNLSASEGVVKEAFSGKNGSWECEIIKEGFSFNYWIKDDKTRIVAKTAGKTIIILFLGDEKYTYLASRDEWVKTKISSEDKRPDLESIPNERVYCKKVEIDDAKFVILKEKIRVV